MVVELVKSILHCTFSLFVAQIASHRLPDDYLTRNMFPFGFPFKRRRNRRSDTTLRKATIPLNFFSLSIDFIQENVFPEKNVTIDTIVIADKLCMTRSVNVTRNNVSDETLL